MLLTPSLVFRRSMSKVCLEKLLNKKIRLTIAIVIKMATPDSNLNDHKQRRHIRLASKSDIAQIWAIDSSATQAFGSIPALADLAVPEDSPEKFQNWLEHGRVYLAIEEDDSQHQQAVGFIAGHEVEDDEVLHIVEIGVHENHQRGGFGGMLLEAMFRWAQDIARQKNRDVARVTLTTYPDVPWNGPWYRKHGFVEVDAERLGPWHVEEVKYLVRPGYRRCCMLWENRVVTECKGDTGTG